MMTPEEKAKELVDKFCTVGIANHGLISYNAAIHCSTICVQEILDNFSHREGHTISEFNFWNDVLREIDNL